MTTLYEHKLPHSICVSSFIWFPESFRILFFIIDERNHVIYFALVSFNDQLDPAHPDSTRECLN